MSNVKYRAGRGRSRKTEKVLLIYINGAVE